MRLRLAREAALVLAHTGADAADDLLHRAPGGERRSGLGKGHALLSYHAPRLGLGSLSAARELQHAQGHHGLHLVTKARGIAGEFQPLQKHGLRIRGMGGANTRAWRSKALQTQPAHLVVLRERPPLPAVDLSTFARKGHDDFLYRDWNEVIASQFSL
jgi:hypothetical protein